MVRSLVVVTVMLTVVLTAAFSAPAPSVHAPDEVERGTPLVVHLDSGSDVVQLQTALYRVDGVRVVATNGYRSTTARDVPVWVSLLGVPATAAPGPYRLEAVASMRDGRTVTLDRSVTVLPRDFASMRIALSQALSDLRETTDPRRVAQARQIIALVATYDAGSIYNEGPFIVPVEDARVTAGFGDRRVFAYADGNEAQSIHFGIDLAAPVGTPVVASGAGRVAFAEDRIITGNSVVVEHLPGVFGLYYHLDRIDVRQGDLVRRGQQIGTVGMTGLATGPHLHWEFRVAGVPVDPQAFLERPLVDKGAIFRRILNSTAEEPERR
ncbi:MAG: M23 family metallopeptidase [Spirochaetaceae bacterium]|nr:MAG: M23 family metallopeptidase [Spirochaetaceae bacterium]